MRMASEKACEGAAERAQDAAKTRAALFSRDGSSDVILTCLELRGRKNTDIGLCCKGSRFALLAPLISVSDRGR